MKGARFESFSIRSFGIKMICSFILLYCAIFFTPFTANGAIPGSEREALIAFYNSANGDGWNDNSGWKMEPLDTDGFAMPGTENAWFGITVNDDSVEEIVLRYNNLSGTISPELSNLTQLSKLDLMTNQLTGPIPPELADLTNLVYLRLPHNQLTGTIPVELGNLVNLNELALSSNRLTGSIPQELCYLPNLTKLELSFNQLTGNLPPELGNLANLTMLWLAFNELTGPIPPELGYLTNLSTLSLWQNRLTGNIPPELGNLTNLTLLQLSFNELTGPIPSELVNLINLSVLSLGSNELTGSIPSGLGNLVNLSGLSLGRNQLTGGIPPELGNLINLTWLSMSYNQLTGSIPSELGNLVNLVELELSNNQLTDNIPSELEYLENLEALELSDNQLTGPIPVGLGNLIRLTELKLNDNQLTGPIPAEVGNLADLNELDLSDNQLTGPIPSELGNLVNLTHLYLHGNRLTGNVPPELAALVNLEMLTVGGNLLDNPANGTVVLIIDSGVSTQIEPELQQFKTDLEDEGYTVVEEIVGNITPPEVRSYLQELYAQSDEGLEGVILIGNIPYAYQYYERERSDSRIEEYETISYQYYADLDSTFEASPGYVSPGGRDYSFDSHSGDFDWEIWVGVLPYYKGNLTDTVSALKRYFAKNHDYRTCGYDLPEAFLHIGEIYTAETIEEHDELLERLQDGDIAWTPFSSLPSARIYFDSPVGGLSVEQGYADLSAGVADVTATHTHGTPSVLGQIDISWVENNPVKTAIFFSTGCSIGNLDYTENFLAELLYSPTSMVVVAQGQTNPSAPLQSNAEGAFGHNVSSALDSGKNFGQSFLTHVNAPPLISTSLVYWEYLYAPRIILGDPTLTRLTGCEPSPDSGDDSGGDSGGGNSSGSSSGGGGGGCFISMANSEPFVAGSGKTAGDSCGPVLVMMLIFGSVCIYSGFRVLVNRKDLESKYRKKG